MTFILAKSDNLNSIVCPRANKVLSLFFKDNTSCVLSSLEVDEACIVYTDVEQALDDFEYETCRIPNRVINSFKNKDTRFDMRTFLKTSDDKEFTVEQEGDFVSLLCIPLGIQLNFSPKSETLSAEDEFTITTLDFELVDNYETLGDAFTSDIEEALLYFEDITGEITTDVKKEFIEKCK